VGRVERWGGGEVGKGGKGGEVGRLGRWGDIERFGIYLKL